MSSGSPKPSCQGRDWSWSLHSSQGSDETDRLAQCEAADLLPQCGDGEEGEGVREAGYLVDRIEGDFRYDTRAATTNNIRWGPQFRAKSQLALNS